MDGGKITKKEDALYVALIFYIKSEKQCLSLLFIVIVKFSWLVHLYSLRLRLRWLMEERERGFWDWKYHNIINIIQREGRKKNNSSGLTILRKWKRIIIYNIRTWRGSQLMYTYLYRNNPTNCISRIHTGKETRHIRFLLFSLLLMLFVMFFACFSLYSVLRGIDCVCKK